MKLLTVLIVITALCGKLYSQYQAIDIPEFKNLNPADKYPERSILATYTTNFNILISLNGYNAWGPDDHIKALAHHTGGWYKIEIDRQPGFDPYTVCYSTIKIKDAIGDTIWNILLKNHLFDMEDDRTKRLTVSDRTDTIINNGKTEIVEKLFRISDGSEYEFEILTTKSYKKLYFYEPAEYYNFYQNPIERKWVINCINVFEKYLGK